MGKINTMKEIFLVQLEDNQFGAFDRGVFWKLTTFNSTRY